MAKYGSANFKLEFDNSGGTLVDLSAYLLSVNGITVEAILEDATTFGLSWTAMLASGVSQMNAIDLEFFYDDTASSGPDAIFTGAQGNTATRTLKATWGSTKTTSVETIISKVERDPKPKALTRMKVTVQPTGTVTEV